MNQKTFDVGLILAGAGLVLVCISGFGFVVTWFILWVYIGCAGLLAFAIGIMTLLWVLLTELRGFSGQQKLSGREREDALLAIRTLSDKLRHLRMGAEDQIPWGTMQAPSREKVDDTLRLARKIGDRLRVPRFEEKTLIEQALSGIRGEIAKERRSMRRARLPDVGRKHHERVIGLKAAIKIMEEVR